MAIAVAASSVRPAPSNPSSTTSPYPFAAAPDIIRAHQKDAYFQNLLSTRLTDLHRRLLGARSAHAWAGEARAAASLLYLCLTTVPGNRTLGEEYCDLAHVVAGAPPSLARRAALAAGSALAPYLGTLALPRVRAAVRARLLATGRGRIARYLLAHLGALTSGTHVRAAALAVFYFTGAYYSLTKRALGLRYVATTRRHGEGDDRAGYEVLGVLLVMQMAVRAWLHVRATACGGGAAEAEAEAAMRGARVSLDGDTYSGNSDELLLGNVAGGQRGAAEIANTTHTPLGGQMAGMARHDLHAEEVMGWIKGSQQRKCTLCLDPLRDPAATQCGHVFCWACIGDWVREKPECPLCRREALVQHILPLRTA